MSNYSFSNTLDGLNNIDSNNINTDNINCDFLTVNKNSSVPLITPYDTSSNQIASCAFVQDAFTNNLSGYAKLNPTSPQTFTGSTNTFSSNVFINNGSIQNFVGTNGTNTRLQQTTNSFQIVNGNNSQAIILSSRTSTGSPVTGLQIQNGNTAYLQGDASNRITVSNSITPTITIQAPALSNDLSIANTAWIVAKNYLTSSSLTGYALLNSNNTFTATNTFNGIINKNNTTFDYSDYRFVSVQGGGESTQLFQTSSGMGIISITNNKNITIATRDISGISVNGLVCGFGNQAYLQGALNNRIDITGTQATIGGTSVPKITTQLLTNSNNRAIVLHISRPGGP